jgi:hypothetical protein
LEADRRELLSTARLTPFADEFGRTFPPLERDEIVAHLAMQDTIEDNFRRMTQALQEVSRQK